MRSIVGTIDGLNITLDRAEPEPSQTVDEPLWLELQRDGMTFDCSGLAPGPHEPLPPVHEWLGVATAEREERLRCVGLALGPHLRAGQASAPVLRALLTLAREMGTEFVSCRGVCWAAAGTVLARDIFVDLVDRWQAGGGFPAQLVISLRPGLNGGIETRGLAYFTGQELRLEPVCLQDETQGRFLALRLASQLIYQGRLDAPEQASAPDGSALRLEPSANGHFVRVWKG